MTSALHDEWHGSVPFWPLALNARFAATTLWKASKEEQLFDAGVDETIHASTALHQAFRRESAIALELVIKAVIAQRLGNNTAPAGVTFVRRIHDLPDLWADAALPELSEQDHRRLILAKYILKWTGRYPAPSTDSKERTGDWDVYSEDVHRLGRIKLRTPLSYTWHDFERIFGSAAKVFTELVPRLGLNAPRRPPRRGAI